MYRPARRNNRCGVGCARPLRRCVYLRRELNAAARDNMPAAVATKKRACYVYGRRLMASFSGADGRRHGARAGDGRIVMRRRCGVVS